MEKKILSPEMVKRHGHGHGQSKVDSLMEAIVNTAVGFFFAVITNMIVLPLMLGIKVSTGDSMFIAMIFTGISIARSYILRRIFNSLSVWALIRSFLPHLLNISFWVYIEKKSVDRHETHVKRNTLCYIVSPHK